MKFTSCEEDIYSFWARLHQPFKSYEQFLIFDVCTPVGFIQYRQGGFFCLGRLLRPTDLKSGSKWLTASIIDFIIITFNKKLVSRALSDCVSTFITCHSRNYRIIAPDLRKKVLFSTPCLCFCCAGYLGGGIHHH